MSQFFQGTINSGNLPPEVPTSFVTDDGTGIPAAHILNVLGGSGIETYVDPDLSNNLFIKVQNSTTNTGQTINNQTINLSTIDCSVAGTYFFTTQVSTYDVLGLEAAGGQLYTTVRSTGGVVTVIDDTDAIAHRTSGLPDIDYQIVSSGTNAILQVTGQTGFTLDWGAITIYVYRG
jgi:hypothetical protein